MGVERRKDGPRWVGIGAQRGGSTWMTDLLTQHPSVGLGASGRKELHFLNNGLLPDQPRAPWRGLRRGRGVMTREDYAREFAGEGVLGEWTPAYLPSLWCLDTAAQHLSHDVPVFVILRDPVDRFASAMRLESSRSTFSSAGLRNRLLGSYALWCGMYATQLDAWSRVLGVERIHVFQYEQVRANPQGELERAWRVLGLEPVELSQVDAASATSRPSGWDWPDGLSEHLRSAYEPQYAELESKWGIDAALWR